MPTKQASIPRLPPIVPSNAIALDRAIILLGLRARGEQLRPAKVEELVGLLGRYPDPVVASAWKTELKRVRTDEVFKTTG